MMVSLIVGMHAREGLVHQEQADGVDHERAGDLHQHALPARELLGEARGACRSRLTKVE